MTINVRRGARGHRGFAILIILVVVVIIAVLLFAGSLGSDPKTHVAETVRELDMAKSAACGINRNAVATNFINWQIMHAGEPVNPKTLSDLVGGNTCPQGGIFLMGKDGRIYCTKHDPPPPEELKDMMKLYEPTPVPTAESSNTLPPDVATTVTASGAAANKAGK